MIMSPGPMLQIDMSAPLAAPGKPSRDAAASQRLDDVERAHILWVLEQVQGRIKGPDGASARLGLKPSTLYFRMKKLGIGRT
jgi:formate hydrogenlyase transcriptional activator